MPSKYFSSAPRLWSSLAARITRRPGAIWIRYSMSLSSTPASGTDAKVSAMTTFSPPSVSSLGKPKMSYRSAALTSMAEKIELTALGSLWSAIEVVLVLAVGTSGGSAEFVRCDLGGCKQMHAAVAPGCELPSRLTSYNWQLANASRRNGNARRKRAQTDAQRPCSRRRVARLLTGPGALSCRSRVWRWTDRFDCRARSDAGIGERNRRCGSEQRCRTRSGRCRSEERRVGKG